MTLSEKFWRKRLKQLYSNVIYISYFFDVFCLNWLSFLSILQHRHFHEHNWQCWPNWINRTIITGFNKVNFFVQSTKMQLITLQNFNIQTCFGQFFWVFSLKCWFKGQMISRTHLSLPNAYKLMCFDRNINGNWDVKFLECV